MAATTIRRDRTDEEREHARIAVEFLTQDARGEARDVWRRYGSPDLVHHNPWLKSDADSLIEAMTDYAHANPDRVLEVRETIAEGPLVAVHSRVRHNSMGQPWRPFTFSGSKTA